MTPLRSDVAGRLRVQLARGRLQSQSTRAIRGEKRQEHDSSIAKIVLGRHWRQRVVTNEYREKLKCIYGGPTQVHQNRENKKKKITAITGMRHSHEHHTVLKSTHPPLIPISENPYRSPHVPDQSPTASRLSTSQLFRKTVVYPMRPISINLS